MIVVIIAGGSGTRLWPLSTPDFPKHLLTLTGDSSLLQHTYRRAKKLSDKIYVVSEAGHIDHVRDQLPELSEDAFIIEPARRGTAGCIVAGLHYIQSRCEASEPIAFIHADHLIRDVNGFAYTFSLAAQASTEHKKITLIGIEPTAPSTGFGYIEKADIVTDGGLVYHVAGFKEKPDFKTAQRYQGSGKYLWNCGYFVGSLETFTKALEQFSPKWKQAYDSLVATESQADFEQAYLALENEAIDYALMEVDPELLVVPATFDWMDVGSFSDVHKAVESDESGNYFKSVKQLGLVDVENTMVINHEDHKQIGVVGLDNVAIINTPEALLVVRKDLDQKVKDVVNQLKDSDD